MSMVRSLGQMGVRYLRLEGVRCLRLEGVRRLGLVELWKNEWTQIHLVLENKDIIFYIHYVVGQTLNQVNLMKNVLTLREVVII